ncbi:hypothetical protein ABKP09_20010 [Peribacillus frigoritolerans]|uniref:hypothetical protein n=1 Tax=Peribacillus frigoritolerans TaxID=450367 RepID=UPI0032B40DC3
MAFTGKKHKGSRTLTAETIENRRTFSKLMNEIKETDEEKDKQLRESMFIAMFEHLSHSSQKELIEWATNESWNTLIPK